jgi:hypothetical protein
MLIISLLTVLLNKHIGKYYPNKLHTTEIFQSIRPDSPIHIEVCILKDDSQTLRVTILYYLSNDRTLVAAKMETSYRVSENSINYFA